MIQEDSSQIKFGKLSPWTGEIFQLIRKDIKGEYLRQNPQFASRHFPKKALDKLTAEEIVAACEAELQEGNEAFAEWAIARWVMKNGEIYHYFATELAKINPQFDEIEAIDEKVAERLLSFAVAEFGAKTTYLFSVMNSVSFLPQTFEKLKSAALAEPVSSENVPQAGESVESVKAHYEALMRKMVDKYERRLQGVEKKYAVDVEGLRKQIAKLHRERAHVR